MKKFLALSALVLCTYSMAAEVVLMKPGVAVCKSKYDMYQAKRSNIYNISNVETKDLGESVEITMTVKILDCVEKDGKYAFEVKENHANTTYDFPSINGDMTIQKIDLYKEMIVTTDNFKIIGKTMLDDNLGEQTISIEVPKDVVDVNRFPTAASRGSNFVIIMLRSKTKFITNESEIGPMLQASGSYRVFFNL